MMLGNSSARFSLADWVAELLSVERALIVSEGREIRAGELRTRVESWQTALLAAGVDRGQTVAISAERAVDSLALFFACVSSGIVPLFVDPRQDREQLGKMLDAIRVQGLYCGTTLDVSAFRARLPYLKWTGEQAAAGSRPFESHEPLQDAPAFAVHSTGTCDLPRAFFHADSAAEWQARALIKALHLKRGTRCWFSGTLASAAVLSLGVFAVLSADGVLVLDDPVKSLAEQRTDSPHSLLLFAQARDRHEWTAEKLLTIKGSVKSVVVTDAPLDDERATLIMRATDADLTYGYYCAEAAGFLALNTLPGVWPFDSVGRPIGGAAFAVLDERGQRLPSGQLGKLAVADVPLPLKTVSLSFKGGERAASVWTINGDWGLMDEQDFVYCAGPERSVFARAGFPVVAFEVEAKLCALDGIEGALVFGVRNEEIEHDVACVVKLKAETALGRDIPLKLLDKIPRYSIPGSLYVTDDFRVTPGGKFVRFGLSSLGKAIENPAELPPVKLPSAGPVIARRHDEETADESLPPE